MGSYYHTRGLGKDPLSSFLVMSLNNFRNAYPLPDDFIIRQIDVINICHTRLFRL